MSLDLTDDFPSPRVPGEWPPCRPGRHGGAATFPPLNDAPRRVGDALAPIFEPDSWRQLGRDRGYRWRERPLDPVVTVPLFGLQVLHGDTARAHRPHRSGLAFTDSAYRRARSRPPRAALPALPRRLVATCRPPSDAVGLWHGPRTRLVDGAGVSRPATTGLQRGFGQPTDQAAGCGSLVARVLALFPAGTGRLQHVPTAPPREHERSRVAGRHPEMRPGDVLVGGRAFGPFAHLATPMTSCP